jgi:hypothetical protein
MILWLYVADFVLRGLMWLSFAMAGSLLLLSAALWVDVLIGRWE